MNVGLIDCNVEQLLKETPLEVHYKLKKVLLKGIQTEETAKTIYPNAEVVSDLHEIIHDDSIELVLISAPANAHLELVSAALNAGKHVRVI